MPTKELFNDKPRLCACGCGASLEGMHKNRITAPGHYETVRTQRAVHELETRAETNEQKFAAVLANNPAIYIKIVREVIKLRSSFIPESRWSANYFINWLRTYHRIHINNNCHGPFCDWFEREFGVTLNRRKTKLERMRQ